MQNLFGNMQNLHIAINKQNQKNKNAEQTMSNKCAKFACGSNNFKNTNQSVNDKILSAETT